MSERIERYVLHLSLPADVPARAGLVSVTWPGGPPVEAGVLGAYFVEPDVFMAEQDAASDLLAVVRRVVQNFDARGWGIATADVDALRAFIASPAAPPAPASVETTP